jgi:hypothetical protein
VSLVRIIDPLYVIRCDHPGCTAEHKGEPGWDQTVESGAKRSAELAGWQIRPWSGAGSRSAPDLCPAHSNPDGES